MAVNQTNNIRRGSELTVAKNTSASQQGLAVNATDAAKQTTSTLLSSGKGDRGGGDAVAFGAQYGRMGTNSIVNVSRGAGRHIRGGAQTAADLIAIEKQQKAVGNTVGGARKTINTSKLTKGSYLRKKYHVGKTKYIGEKLKDGEVSKAKGVAKAPKKAGSAGFDALERADDSGVVSATRSGTNATIKGAKGVVKTSKTVAYSPYRSVKGAKRAHKVVKAFRSGGLKHAWRVRKKLKKARQLEKASRKAGRLAVRGIKTGGKAAVKGVAAGVKGLLKAVVAGVSSLVSTVGIAILPIALIFFLMVGIMTSLIAKKWQDQSIGGLTGNQATIAIALKEAGYNNAQIAGIMSNIMCESGYEPGRYEGDYDNTYEWLSQSQIASDNGYGLCQWSFGRKRNLIGWCNASHEPHNNINIQCNFLIDELNNGVYGPGKAADYVGYYYLSWDQWKSTPDEEGQVDKLSQTFTWQFERCGATYYASRWENQKQEAHRIFLALQNTTGNEIADRALAEQGKPYVWGAAGPEGYDCSGLCCYAITGEHSHPWTASTFLSWPHVSGSNLDEMLNNAQPGDICTSGGHCGIYVGNRQMCHAPQQGEVVKVSNVQSGMIIVRKE